MPDIYTWIHDHLGLPPDVQQHLFQTLVAIQVIWLLRFLLLRAVLRGAGDRPGVQFRWRKSTAYVATALGILVAALIWSRGIGTLATSIGIFSAGLAVALKDPIVNIAGWAFIMTRRPFRIGDRIQIGDHVGDVIDIRIFQFTLMEIGNWIDADQATGRVIHVPNGLVFTNVQANYNQEFPYIWNEISVLITFESDWRKAKEMFERIVDAEAGATSVSARKRFRIAARKFLLLDDNLDPSVYTSVRDSGVLLSMRYLCDPRERRVTEARIWEEVLKALATTPEIALAYPTTRFYNAGEGRPKSD
jgi:small-conductance mechanosensitive channel